MNKKLVALAVAGVLGAPLVAQAQTANVTMYGSFRLALASTKFDNNQRVTSVDNISSRWGVRGTESLGGGLNAFFHLEEGIGIDVVGNSGQIGIREAWVGLNGAFGEFKLGTGLTPYDDVMGMNHNSIVGDFNNINYRWYGNGFTNYNSCIGVAFDARYGNSLSYQTPKFGPMYARTQYAILNETASGRRCSGWDTALIGGFGPVQWGLAYAKHNNFRTTSATALDHDADNFSGTIKGSFGMFDWNLGAEEAKYKGNHSNGTAKYRGFVAGAGVNFGPTKVGIDFASRNNAVGVINPNALVPSLVSVTNGGGKNYTLYVNHNFSKRTIGYLWVGQDKPEIGNKGNQFAFALRHNF